MLKASGTATQRSTGSAGVEATAQVATVIQNPAHHGQSTSSDQGRVPQRVRTYCLNAGSGGSESRVHKRVSRAAASAQMNTHGDVTHARLTPSTAPCARRSPGSTA